MVQLPKESKVDCNLITLNQLYVTSTNLKRQRLAIKVLYIKIDNNIHVLKNVVWVVTILYFKPEVLALVMLKHLRNAMLLYIKDRQNLYTNQTIAVIQMCGFHS